MSDKHVVAALQRSVADLELRLREVVRERDEAYEDRRKARQERDEARIASRELREAIVDWCACLDAQDGRRFDLAPAIAHAEWLAGMTDAEIVIEAREWANGEPLVTERGGRQ